MNAPERARRLRQAFGAVRAVTQSLAERLGPEDQCVQSMAEASPTKWHLAHTTWFFEEFVLARLDPDARRFDPSYAFLFNSYYQAVGPRVPRATRGLLTRPTVEEVRRYRQAVDERIVRLLDAPPASERIDAPLDALLDLVELGLHHEQQHQELLLTDIKHLFFSSPLRPSYASGAAVVASGNPPASRDPPHVVWLEHGGGLHEIGHAGGAFAYDNEAPRHPVFLQPFRLASRLVTNGEFARFVADRGYERPQLWLSDGFDWITTNRLRAPIYWSDGGGQWREFTLHGMQPLALDAPVCHVSFFEADAYARWADARLPTEAEWEVAVGATPITGNLLESGRLHPQLARAPAGDDLVQPFGDVWQWTASPYVGYPGYRPPAGAVGEYNGKFMSNQYVLRGGSCLTPQSHLRVTYRNFFPATARWQMTGLRLAADL